MLGWLETLPAVGRRERMKRRRKRRGLSSSITLTDVLSFSSGSNSAFDSSNEFSEATKLCNVFACGKKNHTHLMKPHTQTLVVRGNEPGYEVTPDMGMRLYLTWV